MWNVRPSVSSLFLGVPWDPGDVRPSSKSFALIAALISLLFY